MAAVGEEQRSGNPNYPGYPPHVSGGPKQDAGARNGPAQGRPGARKGQSVHQSYRARSAPDREGISTRGAVGLVAAVVVLMMIGGAASAVLFGGASPVTHPHQTKAGGNTFAIASGNGQLPASNAALMGIEKVNGKQAPRFTLTDQHGATISLGRLLAHHAVVLGFMDDTCRDICPIVAHEIADAYHDLGGTASKVAFVAVNVNAAHSATSSLRSFITTHGNGLASVPDFYYVTGQPAQLRPVWARYHIRVIVKPTGGVVHSDLLYFIAPGGRMVDTATPFANMRANGTGWLPPATITQWGQGIAQYARAALKA